MKHMANYTTTENKQAFLSYMCFASYLCCFFPLLTRDRPSQIVEGDEIFPCLLHFTPLKSDWTATQTPVEWRIEFTEQTKHLYGFRSSSIPVWSMTQHKHTVNKWTTGITDHSKHSTHSNCKRFCKYKLKIQNLTDYLLCRFRMFHAQGCCCNESQRVWEKSILWLGLSLQRAQTCLSLHACRSYRYETCLLCQPQKTLYILTPNSM